MAKEDRYELILKALETDGKVGFDNLALKLDVSSDTVRRDIEQLNKMGLLSKIRGGAAVRSKLPFAFLDRVKEFNEGKKIIALKAQQFIKPGQTIFMDGGTTNCAVATHFPVDINLRVITNNLALLPILSHFPNIEIVVLGGIYYRELEINAGQQTCDNTAQYVADLYLMGTCGVDSQMGITALLREDGEVKQAMHRSALKTAILSDRQKLGIIEYFKVADISEVHTLITDLPSSHASLDAFRTQSLQIQ
ncbi:transcriptional regulator, DeoR family [Mucilaginibacter lappiensis]|uniref:DeoR/GlpR family transcriptional regulator of sugar metabolism n=1 Tax=Mucilaginibacter lappiensis TaxID=354630 RepID=A0ABR6PTJ1_9SPHI|nr:DeoR/GlpR family DNA-binding transcription regulator [Mucilaginibacter lappiensis]MBB6113064.1 DeoR/GlpR family transcriptional regulator of sugar metabolism [Mucilaginibacter lappiensis]SIS10831.1 transcriptional regulator, DeoR family [Mucilaginibacter lappiensis]